MSGNRPPRGNPVKGAGGVGSGPRRPGPDTQGAADMDTDTDTDMDTDRPEEPGRAAGLAQTLRPRPRRPGRADRHLRGRGPEPPLLSWQPPVGGALPGSLLDAQQTPRRFCGTQGGPAGRVAARLPSPRQPRGSVTACGFEEESARLKENEAPLLDLTFLGLQMPPKHSRGILKTSET